MKASSRNLMKRSARVFVSHLNAGKQTTLRTFLALCHDATQYLIDLLWQQQDTGKGFAALPVVHRAVNRFGITTRLGQCLAKQAKEAIAASRELDNIKPLLRKHTATLFYHFVAVEPFRGEGFDYAVRLIGSGAPKLTIPVKSTAVLNKFLADSWRISKTIRLGERDGKLFIGLIVEKPRPPLKTEGRIVGMDSNYKAGLVFSDGQVVGGELYARIQEFGKRQKNTHEEIKSMLGQALKSLDLSGIRMLCVEDLKRVKHGKRGTFSRRLNRRLSHWQYALCLQLLGRMCEESGVRLEMKNPWKTSQFCRLCGKWERRNRQGDRFKCVHCGHTSNADLNAAMNLECLGMAGYYGIRNLQAEMS